MKQVIVSELKARLSAYLADVRKGETVVVCDRKTPIARLIPYTQDTNELGIEEPSSSNQKLMRPRAVRLRKQIDVAKLLREDRNHR